MFTPMGLQDAPAKPRANAARDFTIHGAPQFAEGGRLYQLAFEVWRAAVEPAFLHKGGPDIPFMVFKEGTLFRADP